MSNWITRITAATLLAASFASGGTTPGHAQPLPGTTCNLFPADHVLNTDISSLPVNAQSATWMSNMTQHSNLHPDLGTFAQQYGMPTNVAPPPTTGVTPSFLYDSESDHPVEGYPIDQNTLIEGGPGAPSGSDRHALVVDKNRCKLYEIYNLQNFTNGQQPQAGSGAVWDLGSDAMRPDGWTSADAAGLPITPLLLRSDEILAGSITHAIRFTNHCSNGYIWPASHQASTCGAGSPPMGARFRLRSSFDISSFSANTQAVMRAFQHYGLVLADNGSDWFFSGTTDDWWGTTAGSQVVSELKTVPANQFDAVDESGMQVAAGSYQAVSCTSTPLQLSYFSWYDNATYGMVGDNIHLLNRGAATSTGCVTLGGTSIPFSVPASSERNLHFPPGSIGGPVVVAVMSGPAVLASQRVQYFQSFNEVWAMLPSQASTASYINWYDRASPGMLADNIHVFNPGTTTANVTVALASTMPMSFSLAPGAEQHVNFAPGSIGGAVDITSDQPVLASQRVQYYQSFNEIVARSAAQASMKSYYNWFDKATYGMVSDNIHVFNPFNTLAQVTVSMPGQADLHLTLGANRVDWVAFPVGSIGGPITVMSDNPILTSQRVQYFQSFNEVPSETSADALTTSNIMWFDKATYGMVGDNIHVLNTSGSTAIVSVSVPGGTTQNLSLAPGVEGYVTFALGVIGGPVTISSNVPVLSAQRVQYFQSFNEVQAQ